MLKVVFPGLITLFLLAGCQESTNSEVTPTDVVRGPDDKVFIIDRTGKQWDITHAVDRYNFSPNQFQHGVGPRTIRPIIAPEFFCPGETGFPNADQDNLVIGTTLHGETRAYPINILKSFEIVDERFDSSYVAVAY